MQKKQEMNLGVQDIWPIALVLIITGVGIAFGLDVTDTIQDDFITNTAGCNSTVTSDCGFAYNATDYSQESVAELTDKLPTIALVIVAAILITILVRNLGSLA